MDYEIILRLSLAALWGGLVGAEREYRGKSAGFRTMIMISIGACLFTVLSTIIGAQNSQDRIASNIVTGIGFLGAGVIFQGNNKINGITTAATIWAVAAVGMSIGIGYYWGAAITSAFIIIILGVLPFLEKYIDKLNQSKYYTIESEYSSDIKDKIEQYFKASNLKFNIVKQLKIGKEYQISWTSEGSFKNHEIFIKNVLNDESIKRFEY